MRRFLVVLTLFAMAALHAPAEAQTISKIVRKTGLSPEDFNIMGEKAASLYDTANPQPGRIISWTNPDSGSHGRVRLAAMRKNCAFLQHFVHPKGAEKSTELRLQLCKDASGKWLLQP
ncbi:MAG: hypothetical protein AB3N23_21205 [Paracoccaceae bacterium]